MYYIKSCGSLVVDFDGGVCLYASLSRVQVIG